MQVATNIAAMLHFGGRTKSCRETLYVLTEKKIPMRIYSIGNNSSALAEKKLISLKLIRNSEALGTIFNAKFLLLKPCCFGSS